MSVRFFIGSRCRHSEHAIADGSIQHEQLCKNQHVLGGAPGLEPLIRTPGMERGPRQASVEQCTQA